MLIEFDTEVAKVSDKLIDYLREELLKMEHAFPHISRAEVRLKTDKDFIPTADKICSIRLEVTGNDLMSYRRANTFRNAAHGAVNELWPLVEDELKHLNEPPDIITSTVKV
jgi:hypothetical protein